MALPISTPEHLSIIQIGYVVADIDSAIQKWVEAFGVGQFTVFRHVPLISVTYRGAAASLDMTMALAQAGEVQIELIQQHCDAPSIFRETPGAEPAQFLHHVAVYPQNHQALVDHYVSRGFPIAGELENRPGCGPTFIDTRELTGHMLEVYRRDPLLEMTYASVKARSQSRDRKSPIIDWPTLPRPRRQ